jgi:hypothetical protein
MGQFLNAIRKKLGLDPKRDKTLLGTIPNEVIISRATQNESVDPSAPGDNPVVLAPMRMSPPTPSHGIVVNKAMEIAKAHGAPHHVILTRTQDVVKKKTGAAIRNPLTPEQKLKHAKRFFPDANIEMASQERPNLLSQAAELHQKGHKHLIVVAGSDRVPEYQNLLNKYNGQIGKHGYFNFPKISVVAAGAERDPDAEGAAGWSGTKSRQTAETGDFNTFRKKAVPSHINDKHAKELYDDLRSGMGLHNQVSEASEGYPVSAIPTRPIPTKDARDAKGKKSSLNRLPPPEDTGNIGLDSDIGDGKKDFNLLRRRALKRAVQVGFLEGYDDIEGIGALDTPKYPESNAPTTQAMKTSRIPSKKIRAEGTFTDVPGEQGSANYGSDVDNSSNDTMIRTSKSSKKFKSVRESLRTDNPCWKGYEPVGTKKKGGKTVPNCVPKEETEEVELISERGEDKKGWYRSTESGAGITRKGAKAMGIKTAVTTPPSKLDPNGKAAKRRKSFCARMGGMKGPMKDEKGRPTRKAMSLRRWNCEEAEPILELSTDTINATRREIEKRASNPMMNPVKKEKHLNSFRTGTHKILGLAKVNATDPIKEHIVKVKGGYQLQSKSTGKNLGTYPSKEGAEKRERQVQYFKHQHEETELDEVFQNDIEQSNKLGSVSLGKPLRAGHTRIGTLPNGHEVHFKKAGAQHQYRVVDPKTKKVNTVLTTKPHKGGAEEIDTLAGNNDSGGAHHLYQHLVLHHNKVLSSNNQSAGARRVWAKAASHRSIGTHGYDPKKNAAFHAHPSEDEHYSTDDDYDKTVSDRASSKRDKRKYDKEIRDIQSNDDKYIVMHKKLKEETLTDRVKAIMEGRQ